MITRKFWLFSWIFLKKKYTHLNIFLDYFYKNFLKILIILSNMRTIIRENPQYEEELTTEWSTISNFHLLDDETEQSITEKVNERWFYLYNWITPDELRMSFKADYLSIFQATSIPLAVVTLIAGFMGFFGGGTLGAIIGIMGVLAVFYAIVGIFLFIKMFRKAYLYTKWADVVITDDHLVSGGKILKKDDFEGQRNAFAALEEMFREPIFGKSEMANYIEVEQQNLMQKLQMIAKWGGSIIENVSNSRDAGPIVMVVLLVGFLYSAMMGFVYFAGVAVVSFLAMIFSWIANKILLVTHNKEHVIQGLFHEIMDASISLKDEKKNSVTLLTEAWENEWVENLSERLNTSFEAINKNAETATSKSVTLRKELENSEYKAIFNFPKYDQWIRTQVLTPIEELLTLVKKNEKTIQQTLAEMENSKEHDTGNIWSWTAGKALETQKSRFELQLESFGRMRTMLESYQEKLQ